MLRELALEGGGFASSQDADTNGKEGLTFTWARREAGIPDELLHSFEGGRFILRGAARRDASGGSSSSCASSGRSPRATTRRSPPGTGSTLAALAECGRVLGAAEWIDAARALGEFLLGPISTPEGRLHRTWRDGVAKGTGYLEDYADVANGLLELHAATGELRWLEEANRLARLAVELFADEQNGGFFQTPADGEQLVVRKKIFDDSPSPSGNSMLAYVLLRLARIWGDDELEEKAVSVFRLILGGHAEHPDVVRLGPRRGRPLSRAAARDRDRRAAGQRRGAEGAPALGSARGDRVRAGRRRAAARGQGCWSTGKPAVYVCERFACQAPVTDPRDLR